MPGFFFFGGGVAAAGMLTTILHSFHVSPEFRDYKKKSNFKFKPGIEPGFGKGLLDVTVQTGVSPSTILLGKEEFHLWQVVVLLWAK